MKRIIGITILFATTVALGESVINSVTTTPPGTVTTTTTAPDPCIYSSTFYDRQNCEQAQRARLAREQAEKRDAQSKDTQGQVITPSTEMPAWQQALQPKPINTEKDEAKPQTSSQTP